MEGYIRLQRKYLENGMLQNPDLWQLFCYLMMKASWKEREFIFNDSLIKLNPGQCIIGRKKISEELNTTESKVRTNLNKLTKLGFLTIQTTNRFSVATLVMWSFEQGDNQPLNQPVNQTLTNQSPDFDHIQESKKERKEEIKPQHVELSKLLFQLKKENNIKSKEPNYKTWSNNIRLMIERDGYNEKEVEDLIKWSQKHNFWSTVILSTKKLREKAEQMTLQMNKEIKPKQQQKQPVDEVSQEIYDEEMKKLFGE